MKRITTLAALTAIAVMTAGTAAATNVVFNGGFETPGTTSDALGWQEVASGYNLSTDAFSGNFALELNSPSTNRSEALQNTVADGGQPDLTPGEIVSFSFWSKGFAGTTGFAEYRVAFLSSTGAIVEDLGFATFSNEINESEWTEITRDDVVIPDGANALLVQFGQSIGPINGDNLLGGSVLIDDVNFTVVPEPSSLALLGLGGLAMLRRRRRND